MDANVEATATREKLSPVVISSLVVAGAGQVLWMAALVWLFLRIF
jgi:hypothetical protein